MFRKARGMTCTVAAIKPKRRRHSLQVTLAPSRNWDKQTAGVFSTDSEVLSAHANMHWTVQIIVVLLNIAWIVFFLPPDPFSVFVQRRYIDEDMLFGDFCIQLPPVNIKSDKNDTNTTSLESTESSLTLQDNQSVDKSQQDCQCNKTNIQQKDLYYSKMSDIELRPPAPGCEPKIIMKFPNMEVCLDIEIYISAIGPLAPDLNDTSTSSLVGQMTPDSPPVLELTSSEVTTNSGDFCQ
ncbi:uncharacterized protein LOC127349512 isoform X2 [Scomber scombrus]|uniref:Uncharacterized protein LOC127349512 isoform X2 n=1 Tax=Scomber scombrus TaxID=13677 RepID=A0AAV1P0A7_SCOSC